MTKYIKLLRVEQWVKNLFVFLPLFFSGNITNADLVLKSIVAFVVFSLAASFIYILNDYSDVDSDRRHPEKCKRPIASGAVSKNTAIIFMSMVLAAGLLLLSGSHFYLHFDIGRDRKSVV